MASAIYFHAESTNPDNKITVKSTIGEDITGRYGVLTFQQKGLDLSIFLDKKITRELLNTARRIDRGLNK